MDKSVDDDMVAELCWLLVVVVLLLFGEGQNESRCGLFVRKLEV